MKGLTRKPSTSPCTLAGVLLLVAGCGGGGAAWNPPKVEHGTSSLHLVSISNNQMINLRCSGHGSPTVLLESGFGADSEAWYKVRPPLARQTRVCAYDRAGYGYSDVGPLPRSGAAIARDLDQALRAARIDGPYIVVGHSAGGLYARLFAARRPGDVKGLILLDPTVERRAPQPVGDGLDGVRRRLHRCMEASETSPQPPLDDPLWSGCISPKATEHSVELARRPATWQGQISELDSIFGATSDQVARIGPVLSDIPVYVITASDTAATTPRVPFGPPLSIWEAQHQRIASTSRRGFQTTVLSPHLVMIARPDVVIAAVKELIAATRANRLPEPLPASETLPAPGSDKPESLFAIPNPFEQPSSLAPPEALK